ncbi:MAG: recombination-associated protein RdgC [Casimicrobiaceae bacterium]
MLSSPAFLALRRYVLKSLIAYTLVSKFEHTREALEAALAKKRFQACGAHEEKTLGWAPPRGDEHESLVEVVAGQLWLRLKSESKLLPASVVNRMAAERMKRIEQAGGKRGRVSRRDLREETRMELLPRAFTKVDSRRIWIDRMHQRVLIEAGSPKAADEAVALLLATFDGLELIPLATERTSAAIMAEWLTTFDLPGNLALDRDCELRALDETRATVRYSRHSIESDEVRRHIQAGKMPKQVGLTYAGRVSCVLTDAFHLKRIRFLELVAEEEHADRDEEAFDANATLAAGELTPLLDELIEAHGGLLKP